MCTHNKDPTEENYTGPVIKRRLSKQGRKKRQTEHTSLYTKAGCSALGKPAAGTYQRSRLMSLNTNFSFFTAMGLQRQRMQSSGSIYREQPRNCLLHKIAKINVQTVIQCYFMG